MKTQMILLALLFASAAAAKSRAVKLTVTNHCVCTELTVQADCGNYSSCSWDATNSKCTAKAATTTNCADYKEQPGCDAITGCAWTNTGACAAFTKCADYTIATTANAAQCYLKDPTCVPGTASATTVPCTTGTVKCSDVTDQTVCPQLSESATSICTLSTTTTKCISQDISKCSTITEETVCKNYFCAFASGKCAAPTCAGQTQDACKLIRADATGSYQICTYANTACADAADTTALTAANCYTSTSGFYRWDGSTCVACTGSSSNAFLLAFLALLAVLMF